MAELRSRLQAVETSAAQRAAKVMPANIGSRDMMAFGKS